MLPTGMMWRGNKLVTRVDVPKVLVPIIGKTSLKKSLRTGDVAEAKVRHYPVMAEFERIIDKARKQLRGEVVPPADGPLPVVYLSEQESQAYRAFQASKPENQIRQMLTDARLLPESKKPISLHQVFDQWKLERQPTLNTAAEYEGALKLFIAQNGYLSVDKYTIEHSRQWKAYVVNLPNKAHSTKGKWFGAVKTLFAFADRQEYLNTNPFAKIVLEKPKRAKETPRNEWDRDELQSFFSSPLYTEGLKYKVGEAAWWLPILSLYHGAAAGELCQLDHADLVVRDGIHCLKITPTAEDNEEGEVEKSTKTGYRVRIVPLHKRLIELGFLEYARSVKGKKLFPKIRPDTRNRWSGYFSTWFRNYRQKHNLYRRWTDFHSFRHTFKTASRLMPEEYHDALTGHAKTSVGRTYGSYPIRELKKHLDKVKFDVAIPKWKAR